MTPAPQAAAPWVGRTVTCAECGRGWRLEEGDVLIRGYGTRGNSRSRVRFLHCVKVNLSCDHLLELTGDAMHQLIDSAIVTH